MQKKKNYNQVNYLSILLLLLFIISCGSTAPLKERDLARTRIDEARKVRAEEYAKTEYDSSNNNFETGEGLIDLEKKTTGNTEAQKAYLVAITEAELAYNKSVGPYTQGLLDDFSNQVEEARKEKIHNAVRDKYEEMTNLWEEAQQAYEAEEYIQAIDAIPSLIDDLNNLIALTREFKMLVDEEDKKAVSLFGEVEKEKAPNATPDEYQQSQTIYSQIKENNEQGFYQASLAEYPTLVDGLERILLLIAELKMLIELEDKKVNDLFAEGERQKARAATPDELRQNQAVHSQLKEQNQNGYYSASLEEYPGLVGELERMLLIIEEKRILARQSLQEAEERISSVQEQNEELDNEISTQY